MPPRCRPPAADLVGGLARAARRGRRGAAPGRPGSSPGCAPSARPAFGADADRLFLTADTLEQAGRPELAARRAARLLAGGGACRSPTSAARRAPTRSPWPAPERRVLAVDRDPVARELTAANAAALGRRRPGRGRSTATPSTWSPVPRDGAVAGCAAAALDPARRAGGRRQLDPDRWSPPWSTVTALLERVPASVVKVAPGLDHDRVPAGRRGRVGLGRRLDRRGAAVGPRARGDLAPGDAWSTRRRCTSSTADADPGPAPGRAGARLAARARPGGHPLRARGAGRRRPRRHAGRPDDRLPDLRRAARTARGCSSYRVDEVLPFNLKKLKALLRSRGRRPGDGQEARLRDRARSRSPGGCAARAPRTRPSSSPGWPAPDRAGLRPPADRSRR